MEPAGRVQEDHVVAVANGMLHGSLGNVHGVGLAHLEHRQTQLLAADFQLPDGGWTVDVTGHQEGVPALAFHQARQLGAVGGLTSALETHQHHHSGTLGVDGNVLCFAAHEAGELFVDDFHNHLGRGEGLQHVGANTALGHRFGEVLDHLVAHVGFQQGQADLPHGLFDIGLLQNFPGQTGGRRVFAPGQGLCCRPDARQRLPAGEIPGGCANVPFHGP